MFKNQKKADKRENGGGAGQGEKGLLNVFSSTILERRLT
jgi:hypothetical protein